MKDLHPAWIATKLIAKIVLRKQTKKSIRYLKHVFMTMKDHQHNQKFSKEQNHNDFRLERIDQFHHKVDPLWGKPRYSFFVHRDKQYLNWRYFDHPDTFTVLAAIKEKEYLGYIALKLSNDKQTGILCDFVTVNDRLDVFLRLVCESEKVLKQNGAKKITLMCVAGSTYYDTLSTLGYYDPGRENYNPIFIYAKTEIGKRILENQGRWHFTFGDTDEV